MMKCLILLLSIYSQLAFASEIELRKEVLALLPQELSSLSDTDTYESVKAQFKDKIIDTKDKQTLFLGYFTKDNDVTIGFKDGKFSYVFIKLASKNRNAIFEKTIDSLSSSQKAKFDKSLKEGGGHEFGRELAIELPEQAMKLLFKNNEAKDLHSVVFWNKGAKAP